MTTLPFLPCGVVKFFDAFAAAFALVLSVARAAKEQTYQTDNDGCNECSEISLADISRFLWNLVQEFNRSKFKVIESDGAAKSPLAQSTPHRRPKKSYA